jgi:hypothetical protein
MFNLLLKTFSGFVFRIEFSHQNKNRQTGSYRRLKGECSWAAVVIQKPGQWENETLSSKR